VTELLAIAGSISTLGLAIMLVVVLRWGMKRGDGEADVRKERDTATLRAERAEFDLSKTKPALTVAEATIVTLTEELANARARTSLGTGLRPDDVGNRLLRAAGSEGAGGPLPAESGALVPVDEPTVEAEAAPVRNLHPIDVLR
jgi:hypothetical protein